MRTSLHFAACFQQLQICALPDTSPLDGPPCFWAACSCCCKPAVCYATLAVGPCQLRL